MSNFSEEKIEIDGKEYTLFLNRKGIVAWEKYNKEEVKKVQEIQDKYKDLLNGKESKMNEENPFEDVTEIDDDTKMMEKMFIKLYWIMLYTNHKMTLKEVEELWSKAIAEYGLEQLGELANQMIEDANKDLLGKQEVKKLTALRPKK